MNACLRYICNSPPYDHISASCTQLGWLQSDKLKDFHTVCLVCRLLSEKEPQYRASNLNLSYHHNINTRSHLSSILPVPVNKTKTYSNSFAVTAFRLWNKLPCSLRKIQSSTSFKIKLRLFFLSSCYNFPQKSRIHSTTSLSNS